jgi:hypothetical protein
MATNFTWSEMPIRDPVDGSRTMAGWIARAQLLAGRVAIIVLANHVLYLVLRIITKSPNPLFFNAWSPFGLDNIVGYAAMLVFQVIHIFTQIIVHLGLSLQKLVYIIHL